MSTLPVVGKTGRIETPFSRFIRSVGYATPFVFSMLCGLLTHASSGGPTRAPSFTQQAMLIRSLFSDPSLCLVLISLAIAPPLFCAYSTIFPSTPRTFPIEEGDLAQQRGTFWLLLLIGSAAAVFAGALPYWLLRPSFPSLPLLASLILLPLLCVAYGAFLLWQYPAGYHLAMRYQLIWPVILSVALPFYLGSVYQPLKNGSYAPLMPIGGLGVYALGAETWARTTKKFFYYSAAWILVGVALRYLPSFGEFTSLFLFSLAVAAYSAVFEAWNATARSARVAKTFGTQTTHLYLGSMAALAISGLSVTLLYPATPLGSLFLWLIGAHSILAFVIWHRAGQPSSSLVRNPHWGRYKFWMGLAPFFILLADFLAAGQRATSPFDPDVIPGVAALSSLIWAGLTATRQMDIPEFKVELLGNYFLNKRRFVEHLSVLLIVGAIICYLTFNAAEKRTQYEYWARLANGENDVFELYFIISVLALIYLWNTRPSSGSGSGPAITLIGLLLSVRMFTSVVVGSVVLIGAILANVRFLNATMLSLPFLLATMGGFALNDYVDAERDAVNRPYRAIPSGKLPRSASLYAGVITISGSITCGLLWGDSPIAKVLYLSAGIGVVLYNAVVKYCALAKTIYTAVLSALPFVFCIHEFSYPSIYWSFPLALVLFICGREVAMDVHDINGDAKVGITTGPMVWGISTATRLSVLCQLGGAFLLLPVALGHGPLSIFIVICLIVITAGLCLARLVSPRYLSPSIYISWIPMLLAVVLFFARF